MLTKRIIPCLDVKDGRAVKGTNFINLRDAGDPIELAARYSDEGADELVFLDISASREGRSTFLTLVERIARAIQIPFTVGGGIGTVDDVVRALDAGADKVSLNTAIVLRPEFLAEASKAVGSQSIVAAIDAKRENASPTTVWRASPTAVWRASPTAVWRASPTAVWRGSWRVWIKGGTEQTALDVIAWAKETVARGAGELLITSMDSDGTKKGYDLQLLKTVAEQVSVPLIASGGAGTKEHIKEAIIEGKADAVLAASIFHYQEISLYDIKRYLREHNIPVRL